MGDNINEARSVNSSLQRVSDTIKMGVMQADSAKHQVDQDSSVINEVHDDHKYGLKNALIATSRRLDQLKFSEVQERYMMIASLVLFNAVAVRIIMIRTGVLGVLMSFFGFITS